MSDRIYRLRGQGVDWRLIEGEVVALDVNRSQYVAVNRSGAQLWEMLAEGATRTQLEVRLRDVFGLGEEAARTDVGQFLSGLVAEHLLDADDASP